MPQRAQGLQVFIRRPLCLEFFNDFKLLFHQCFQALSNFSLFWSLKYCVLLWAKGSFALKRRAALAGATLLHYLHSDPDSIHRQWYIIDIKFIKFRAITSCSTNIIVSFM